MSIARHHSEWLSLIEVSGPFLSLPVLMRVFPQGLDSHDSDKFRTLRQAYEEWEDNTEAGARTNPAIHGVWVRFVLTNLLGLTDQAILEQQAIPQSLQASIPEHGEFLRPSLVVAEPGTGKPRLLVQTYPAGQDLDKSVASMTWKASPGTRMMELLHATGVRLGLVTNGERWMLVDAPKSETTGFASWYASIWLDEPITFRAFTSLLGAGRFFNVADGDTLESLLKESAGNQQEVTDQLGYQVRRAVEVLVQSIDRADQDHDRSLLANVPETLLYEAALTVMMRLVFLFSAEERGLLLLDDELYARNYALSTLREQLRKAADDHGEEILERRHDAWCRLLSTCRAVYGGVKHDRMTLPAYGGHLFDPDRFPFLEGRKSGTTWKTCEADPLPVNNRTVLHLLEALQLLEVRMPGGEKAARRLSFRALDIEQIGHVYEGMLDHTAKRATEPMLGLVGTKDREPEVPLSKLEALKLTGDDKLVEFLKEETGKSVSALKKAVVRTVDLHDSNRLGAVVGTDKTLLARIEPFAALVRDDTFGYPVFIPTGSVFVTAGTDRRSSGTHYTPRSLTEPIVQYTLEPLVYVGPAEGTPKEQWQLRPPQELLDLKVCDMACGSGAFLVQGCRYLSDRLVETWEIAEGKLSEGTPGITPHGLPATGAPGEALIPKDSDERMAYAKRLVAQRCLYGVDINPLAAEMAKLSLWLLTLAKDKPFTFLDHAIRCGDSLLGIHSLNQLKTFSLDGSGKQYVFGEEPLENLVDEAMSHRLAIEDSPAETSLDLERKADDLAQSEHLVSFLRCAADLLIAAELRPGNTKEKLTHRNNAAVQIGNLRQSNIRQHYEQAAAEALGVHLTFHWPLEFPEVLNERGGFDALVGNPPFMGGKKISGICGTEYRDYLVSHLADEQRGHADLCAYFFLRSRHLLRTGGLAGLLATNTISQGDTREVGLDQLADNSFITIRAVSSRRWPGTASLDVSHIWLHRGSWTGSFVLDDSSTNGITPFLTPPSTIEGKPYRLKANEDNVYIGSFVLGTGFAIEPSEATSLIAKDAQNKRVLFPYLDGDDLNTRPDQSATRWVVNFFDWPLERQVLTGSSWTTADQRERKRLIQSGVVPMDYDGSVAADYPDCLRIVEERVKPDRTRRDKDGNFALRSPLPQRWWQYADKRPELYRKINGLQQVLVTARVSPTGASTFVAADQVLHEKVVVFPVESASFFALVQSSIHWAWAVMYSSTLGAVTLNYSPSDCFETFPLPRGLDRLSSPPCSTPLDSAARRYHSARQSVMQARHEGLTKIYNRFNDASQASSDLDSLRELHAENDGSVVSAYGWEDLRQKLGHGFHDTKQGIRFTISGLARREVLARLLKLNHERYAQEVAQGLHDKLKPNGTSKRGAKKASDSASGLFGEGV